MLGHSGTLGLQACRDPVHVTLVKGTGKPVFQDDKQLEAVLYTVSAHQELPISRTPVPAIFHKARPGTSAEYSNEAHELIESFTDAELQKCRTHVGFQPAAWG